MSSETWYSILNFELTLTDNVFLHQNKATESMPTIKAKKGADEGIIGEPTPDSFSLPFSSEEDLHQKKLSNYTEKRLHFLFP